MGDRLATIDMGLKVQGAAVPLFGEERELGRGLPPYQVSS